MRAHRWYDVTRRLRTARNFSVQREVSIGDVKVPLRTPEHPELVPRGYLAGLNVPEVLEHIRWIVQKRIMSQDIFLLGFPTSLRRRIVMAAAELCDWEVLCGTLSS